MRWLSFFTGYDEENATRAAEADARLESMGAGLNDKVTDFELDGNSFTVGNQISAQEQSFNADVRSNADSIIGAPLRFFGRVLGATLLAIPLWIWLAAAVVLFFYLGGGPVLRKWFKKNFA